jgi:prepilin signal peptidase PulO-like enzyme (type II secretory pathway)
MSSVAAAVADGEDEGEEYSKAEVATCAGVTVAVAVLLWFLGHHALGIAVVFLMPAAFVDARDRLLPDALTLPAIGAALTYNGFTGHSVEATIGAGLGILALMLVFYFRPERVGLGDVKMIAALGAAMGPELLMVSIVVASVAGGVVMVASKRFRSLGVPMGPFFIVAASLIAVVSTMLPSAMMPFGHVRF